MATNNIAFYRAKHGLTQSELCKKIGMHVHALGYAENHHCNVRLAQKIADELGESVFNILGLDALVILPETKADKDILLNLIKDL